MYKEIINGRVMKRKSCNYFLCPNFRQNDKTRCGTNRVKYCSLECKKIDNESMNLIKEEIQESLITSENWIEKFMGIDDYVIIIEGIKFQLRYEEMVEFISSVRKCNKGNEYLPDAIAKANKIWEFIPVTDY